MRNECPIARNCIVKQHEVLRLADKEGYSLTLLAQLTGIPAETLGTYKDKPSRPASMMPYSAVIKLMKALPDHLAALLVEDADYTIRPKDTREKDWMAFAERTSDFTTKVVRYQATGRGIDHCEDEDLTEEARKLAADAQAMVSA